MKSKQILSIEQMQHLQELGLKLKPSLVHYYKIINIDSGKWYLSVTTGDISEDSPTYQYIPAYTLQDVLDVLPTSIRHNDCTYYLGMAKRGIAYELYSEHGMVQAIQFGRRTLIDAAYEMLCWVLTNKYIQ